MVDTTFPCIVQSGFAANIVANRNYDLPRLVYADYLQELGYDVHAEFIRADIAGIHSMRIASRARLLWQDKIGKYYRTWCNYARNIRWLLWLNTASIDDVGFPRVFVKRGFPYMMFNGATCVQFHNIQRLCHQYPTIERLYTSCGNCIKHLPELGFHNVGQNQWIR